MRLYLAQRLSAMVLVPLMLVHLGVMIYAVRGGLDAAEILARTQGSLLWGSVYGLLVLAVSIHAAIGLRVIAYEWLRVSGFALDLLTTLVGVGLLGLGGRAVYAVVL
jgi:fumarate reductase subunit C